MGACFPSLGLESVVNKPLKSHMASTMPDLQLPSQVLYCLVTKGTYV